MTHIIKVEEKPRTPHFKQEIVTPVTVVEFPKTIAFGVRLLGISATGYYEVVGEVWHTDVEKDFKRKMRAPKKLSDEDFNKKVEALREKLAKSVDVRLLMYTLPREAGLPRKRPDVIESRVGGSELQARFDYALGLLGKEVKIGDHFKVGEYIDITAVTKGKGFAGPVKRHGIHILSRKKRKGRRVVGAIAGWHPSRVSWTAPRPGQMGYNQRTEFTKKILKISENTREINPKGGWKHYGLVQSPYVLIEGSIPGSCKRFIRVRKAMHMTPEKAPQAEEVKISYISTSFRQREQETEET